MQNRFVEEFIENETKKLWDAYLSIDIGIKNGTEPVSASLKKEIERSGNFYVGLQKWLENNDVAEIWLTDDFFECTKLSLKLLLELLKGNSMLTHIRVEEKTAPAVNKALEDALEEALDRGDLLTEWQHEEKSFVIELMRRMIGSEYILRLYEDGKGVIVHAAGRELKTVYFSVREELLNTVKEIVEKRVIDIIGQPEAVHEDDRYFFFPVILRYGLTWIVPEAENMLDAYEIYEDRDYALTETEIPLALMLLKIPEVKCVWP